MLTAAVGAKMRRQIGPRVYRIRDTSMDGNKLSFLLCGDDDRRLALILFLGVTLARSITAPPI